MSATRPPARLSTLQRDLVTWATRSYDQDLGTHTYEIIIDGEPWLINVNSFVTELPSA